ILEINATSIPVIVVAVVNYHAGTGTDPYPIGARDVSLDAGLREEIEEQIEAPLANVVALDLFGLRLTNLPVVPPPPTRSPLFPEDWAWVRADLLAAMDPVHGGAAPTTIAAVYEAQAVLITLAGAILGTALGILLSHAVVDFAPLFGLPNLVILALPIDAIGLTLAVALLAAAFAGLVPSRRAAVLVRTKEALPT